MIFFNIFYSVCSLDILYWMHVQRCLNAFSRRFLDLPFHNGQCKVQWGVSSYFIHTEICQNRGVRRGQNCLIVLAKCKKYSNACFINSDWLDYCKREGFKKNILGRRISRGWQILCSFEGGAKFYEGFEVDLKKGDGWGWAKTYVEGRGVCNFRMGYVILKICSFSIKN